MARMTHSQLAKKLAKRVTGFSTPLGGVSWQIPEDNTSNEIRRLLTFIEDRRIFHIVEDKIRAVRGSHIKRPQYVSDSVQQVRNQITECLKSMQFPERTHKSLEAMRGACREFLDSPMIRDTVSTLPSRGREPVSMSEAVGRFRTKMGIEIAKLCADYEIDVEEALVPLVNYGLKHKPVEPQQP